MAASHKSDQTNEFLNLQKTYWDAWLNTQQQFAAQAQSEGFQKQWDTFFKEWQKNVFNEATPSHNGFSNHFAQSGKQFIDMMQSFYQATGEGKSLEEMTGSWLERVRDTLTCIIEGKNAEGLSMCDPMGITNSMHSLGYYREQQEMFNDFYRKWALYAQKSNTYDREMAKINLEALQAFQHYVSNPPEGEKPLETIKDLYNKWVDITEEVYAKYAVSEKYTKLYGEVVNALMDVKKTANTIIDFFAGQMHLPTREEVDSMHKRVHDLRRDNIQLKKDIAELKAALGKKSSAPASAPARKTTAAAPKAAPKTKKAAAVKNPAKKPAVKKGKK